MAESENRNTRRKGSKLPLLLVALAVLGGLALAVANPFGWGKPTEEQQAAKDPTRRLLVDLKADDISAFEVKPKDGESYRLEREKDRWWLKQGGKSYRADKDKVDKMLEDLPGLRADGMATESPTQYDNMEVGDTTSTLLSIFAGGAAEPKVKLHVGKASPNYASSFVRLNGGKEVWRAEKNVKSLVGFAFADYRSHTPWAFDPATATELTVRRFIAPPAPKEPPAAPKDKKPGDAAPTPPVVAPPPQSDAPADILTFKKDGTLWKHDGANGNQNQVNELLKSMSELSVNEFVDTPDPAVTKLAGRKPSIEVTTPAGKFSITLGGKDVSYWYAQDQDGNVNKASDYSLAFYREIDFSKLTFDDTPKEEPKKDAGKDGAAGKDKDAKLGEAAKPSTK